MAKAKKGPARTPRRQTGKPATAAVQDVEQMPVVDADVAAQLKAEAGLGRAPTPTAPAPTAPVAPGPELATSPGKERWPVKTGTDADVTKVQPKIVPATVEEMIALPRPHDMATPSRTYPAYQSHRASPVETTIWQVDAMIIALKLETDGDYHMVLQGASGETMIAEIPTPRPPFVQASSPWLANIQAARAAVDTTLLKTISTAQFVPYQGKLVPPESLTVRPTARRHPPVKSRTPTSGPAGTTFKTRITPTRARITGVGFFDSVHGQMGVAQANGIELHPVLKIEWL
jgi:hypothetical protein